MKPNEKFARICKKWGLPKDDNTLQLFACFQEVLDFFLIGQYERNKFNFLEAAKLIRLIKNGAGTLKVSSADGRKVEISNDILKAILYMFLNTQLNWQSMGRYAYMGMTTKKEIIQGGSYLGIYFPKGDYTEPYTDEELQRIISWEQVNAKIEKEQTANRRLGFYVNKFMVDVPEVFDYLVDEEGNPLKPALSITQVYNIIGELLEAVGALEQYKGKGWLEERWSVMTNSERRKEVEGWLKTFNNWLSGKRKGGKAHKVNRQEGNKLLRMEKDIRWDIDYIKNQFSELDF